MVGLKYLQSKTNLVTLRKCNLLFQYITIYKLFIFPKSSFQKYQKCSNIRNFGQI